MKKVIMFLAVAMFLISCGGAGKAPTDLITWSTALSICWGTVSYKVFFFISIAVLAAAGYVGNKWYRKGKIDGMQFTIIMVVALVIFLCSFLIRPGEIAANTTVEQAARGGIIGY